tara:strand:- start:2544 stop:2693 length:150 start_codon:yes stop_codon:yes gene_type:complete
VLSILRPAQAFQFRCKHVERPALLLFGFIRGVLTSFVSGVAALTAQLSQ